MSGEESGHSDHSERGTFPWTEYNIGRGGGAGGRKGAAALGSLAGQAPGEGADPMAMRAAEGEAEENVICHLF